MKKSIIILGSVAVVLLMVSSATAVPQVNAESVLKNVKIAEKMKHVAQHVQGIKETASMNGLWDIIQSLLALFQKIKEKFRQILSLIYALIRISKLLMVVCSAIVCIPAGILFGIIGIGCMVAGSIIYIVDPITGGCLVLAGIGWFLWATTAFGIPFLFLMGYGIADIFGP